MLWETSHSSSVSSSSSSLSWACSSSAKAIQVGGRMVKCAVMNFWSHNDKFSGGRPGKSSDSSNVFQTTWSGSLRKWCQDGTSPTSCTASWSSSASSVASGSSRCGIACAYYLKQISNLVKNDNSSIANLKSKFLFLNYFTGGLPRKSVCLFSLLLLSLATLWFVNIR